MGNFPITSSKGDQNIVIIYEYNSNHIYGDPIKYCNAEDLIQSCKKVLSMFMSRGLQPKLHILDNEFSNMFKNYDKS